MTEIATRTFSLEPSNGIQTANVIVSLEFGEEV